ncbi:MAG: hypothetical protein ACRDE6_04655 [Candidatus Limnocylindria bacterium]
MNATPEDIAGKRVLVNVSVAQLEEAVLRALRAGQEPQTVRERSGDS